MDQQVPGWLLAGWLYGIWNSFFPITRKMVSSPTFLSLSPINPGFANTERK